MHQQHQLLSKKKRFANAMGDSKAVIAVKCIAQTIATTMEVAPMPLVRVMWWQKILCSKVSRLLDPVVSKKRVPNPVPTMVNAKTTAVACAMAVVLALRVKSTPAQKHATTAVIAIAMVNVNVHWVGRVNPVPLVFVHPTVMYLARVTANAKKKTWGKAWCIVTANATVVSKVKVVPMLPAPRLVLEVIHLLTMICRVARKVAVVKALA